MTMLGWFRGSLADEWSRVIGLDVRHAATLFAVSVAGAAVGTVAVHLFSRGG